ncbi:MAG TPA: hypothetical protein VFO36_03765, partial [Nitrospiraceae bacterium]|nr:hypothetical protein [Nitrospiraceae bacterium]
GFLYARIVGSPNGAAPTTSTTFVNTGVQLANPTAPTSAEIAAANAVLTNQMLDDIVEYDPPVG